MNNKKRLIELRDVMDSAFEEGDKDKHRIAFDEWVVLMRVEFGEDFVNALLKAYSDALQPSQP